MFSPKLSNDIVWKKTQNPTKWESDGDNDTFVFLLTLVSMLREQDS